jgi:hypothetical protein
MSFHFLELLSGLACFVFCGVLAAVCVRTKLRSLLGRAPGQESGPFAMPDSITQAAPKNHKQDGRLVTSLAACAALFAFLGMPLGSLPALVPFSWGGLAVLGCLAFALGCEQNWRWDGATRRKAYSLAFLGLSLSLFAWYARQRGMPGELFSLDSYVAMPLAGLMGWRERIGMLLLALVFLLTVRNVQQDLASGLALVPRLEHGETRAAVVAALLRQIWILAVLGVAVCLFVPFCPAGWLGISGVTGVAVDALVFWLKVLIADHVLWLAANAFPQAFARLSLAHIPLAGIGALCIVFA